MPSKAEPYSQAKYSNGTSFDGPLSVLENSIYGYQVAKYPSTGLGTEIPSYIVFYVNLPDSAKFRVEGESIVEGVESVSNQNISLSRGVNQLLTDAKKSAAAVGLINAGGNIFSGLLGVAKENPGAVIGGVKDLGKGAGTLGGAAVIGLTSETIKKRPKYNRIKDCMAIYMPDTVFHTYNHNYDALSLTDAMGDVGLAQRGINALSGDGFSGFLSGVKQLGGGSVFRPGGNIEAGGLEIAGTIAEKSGMVGPGYKAALLASQGAAINPQVELLYKSTSNRSFVFEFKFQPRSSEETKQINDIIRKFRKYAAPDLANASGTYFSPPGQFDIEYRFQNGINPNIGRISTCVLENIAVNYSSAGQFSTFNDGMPVEISMQLTFKEADIITRGMVEGGGF